LSSPRLVALAAGAPSPRGAPFLELLDRSLAVVLERWLDAAECARWASAVLAAEGAWTADWGGEQFSLGRAFYTHLEQGRAREYFANAAASDGAVERALPGMQARVIALVGELVGGEARQRRGWCGPGVHVFPPGEPVAEDGGVVHFDHEGLTERHMDAGRPALSIVIMLQPPERGGGLRLWDVFYEGDADVDADELDEPAGTASYGAGDVVVLSSYRLHQIEPFSGDRSRISITAHAAEVDDGVWDVWF
jgi:hypothetical protein